MHDHRGRDLKVGDIILVPMRVKNLYVGEEFCNVTAESLYGRRPDGSADFFTCNTGVVLRANPGDGNDWGEVYTESTPIPSLRIDDPSASAA